MEVDPRSYEEEFCGCWDPEKAIMDAGTLEFIREQFKTFTDDDVFIDCGANTGLMSLHIDKGVAWAIEVSPKIYDVLENNIALNNKKNILPMNRALYSSSVGYNLRPSAWGGTTDIDVTNSLTGEQTITGDELVKKYINPNQKVKMIKIDCEESSFDVLNGFRETLIKYHPIIIVEQHGGVNATWFTQFGYNLRNMITKEENLIVR